MSTPNEYRQRETDRQRGLYDLRVTYRERFAEPAGSSAGEGDPAAAAKPLTGLALIQQRLAESDRLIAELAACAIGSDRRLAEQMQRNRPAILTGQGGEL
jgi:hypothetical protein